MKNTPYLLFLLCFTVSQLTAQITLLPFGERVQEAESIVIGTIDSKVSYWDDARQRIYTLYTIQVDAYLKGHDFYNTIGLITEGGIVDDEMQVTFPNVSLALEQKYAFLLDSDHRQHDYKPYRIQYPQLKQCKAVAFIQGVLPFEHHQYVDAIDLPPMTEAVFFETVQQYTQLPVLAPDGRAYLPTPSHFEAENFLQAPITAITDGTGATPAGGFISGTIVQDNEMVITGTGFGSTTGNVGLAYADNGGASEWRVPSNTTASDVITWSDTEVRIKLPPQAGTGQVRVYDSSNNLVGSSSINIQYAINAVVSDFYNFPQPTRQRIELIDQNLSGGYTFEYNNTVNGYDGTPFFQSSNATSAFENAVVNWRDHTGVNWTISNTGTNEVFAKDDHNVVTWANLSGPLGVTTSYYGGSGSANCNQFDTYWYLSEVDLRFDIRSNWYFGNGTPSGSEVDFETVALHELGHALGLAHVVLPGSLMHYSISNGSTIRTLSASNIDAGSFKVDHSILDKCVHDQGLAVPDPMVLYSNALPVEFLYFKAENINGYAALEWATASETNNAYFVVEKSLDGIHFKEIGRLDGVSQSQTQRIYTFQDADINASIIYYRLKQVDEDSSFNYSETKALHFRIDERNTVRLFPTLLVNQVLTLQCKSQRDQSARIEITNARGQRVHSQSFNLHSGSNEFSLPALHLPSGIYFMKLTYLSGEGSFIEKFVKQ